MPLIVCDECGGIDNTAYTNWWVRNRSEMWPQDKVGKVLCSVHIPSERLDGSKTRFDGTWHGTFDRDHIADYKDNLDAIINYNPNTHGKMEKPSNWPEIV